MQRLAARTIPLCLALAACPGDPGDAATSESAGSTSSTTSAEAAAVTYHRDVKAILDAKCVGCHSPGNIGPFSLQTYAEASMFAPTLPPAIEAGTMPPWTPDNACRTYKHDASLTDDQKRTVLDWVELGAPEGDPADAPPPLEPPAPIDYDLELELPVAYTPTVVPDEYRCFTIPWPKDQDSYITALTVVPGEKSIVHHVIAYAVPPADIPAFQALDDADPDPGYPCYGGPGGGGSDGRTRWIGSWVPGRAGGATPEGTGLHVAPGSLVVVQMHYHPYPGAAPDRSRIRIRTAAAVEREAVVLPFTDPKWPQGTEPMLIPAGEPDVVHGFEADLGNFLPILFPDGPFTPGQPFVVHAAALHMHTFGSRGSLRVVGDDTCLLDIPRWDFDWQGSYPFTETVTVNPGQKIRIECHFDNSAENQPLVDGVRQPPKDIGWGEGTGDEMCLGTLFLTAN